MRWVVLLVLLLPLISAIEISEVELNPLGSDAGNEWVVLYSNDVFDLSNCYLENNDGDTLETNNSFNGYFKYEFSKQWLDNSDEKIMLYCSGNKLDETITFADSKNNDYTWKHCDEWVFSDSGCDIPSGITEAVKSDEKEEIADKDDGKKKPPKIVASFIPAEQKPSVAQKSVQELSPQPISLNPKDIKVKNHKLILDKTVISWASLIIFGIVLGLLFVTDKIKGKQKENEFKNTSGIDY